MHKINHSVRVTRESSLFVQVRYKDQQANYLIVIVIESVAIKKMGMGG